MKEKRRKGCQDWPRSFLHRQGQTTRAQKQAIREHWPRLGLDYRWGTILKLDESFGRKAGTVLEIGFGMGENLVAQAKARPDCDFLGVEVHLPGIGALLKQAGAKGLENIRVIRVDVLRLLSHHLDGPLFDEVCLFFPEPWEREKDHGRRLARPLLAQLLGEHMRPGGSLFLSTDVEDYARHMLQVFSESRGWRNATHSGTWAERPPWRPITRYENRALRDGREIFDLCFQWQ